MEEGLKKGWQDDLANMYKEWPFFQTTLDLVEMVLSYVNLSILLLPLLKTIFYRKAEPKIAARYNELLVPTEYQYIGTNLIALFQKTVEYLSLWYIYKQI